MQTPAEKYLILKLADHIKAQAKNAQFKILNIGAGSSVVIEKALTEAGCRFVSERVDLEPCAVNFPAVQKCWTCSVEEMTPLVSADYQAAFANYVLEHVENLKTSLREIHRILAPGGIFVAAIPNPSAPEFRISKNTPLWFHRWVRGGHGWETKYAYNSIPHLLDLFRECGFEVIDSQRWPCVEQYLHKNPVLGFIGRSYDNMVSFGNLGSLMGNACIMVRKPRQLS